MRAPSLAAIALACLGLARAEPAFGGWQTFNSSHGLAGNEVRAIFEDRSGNLWFGTHTAGVSRYDGATWRTFTTADGLASNDADRIVEDHAGNVWVLGLYTSEFQPGGVSRYDGTTWRNFTTADGLVDNRVSTLLVDREGNVWIGTRGGVSRFDGTTWRTFTTADGLVANSINAIFDDHAGNLWFGTSPGPGVGVSRYDGANWMTFTAGRGTSTGTVTTFLEDRAGNIWCGTTGFGVFRYDGTAWRNFTSADGLGSNGVTAMLEDRAGNLWFGTGSGSPSFGGVTRYDGATFQTLYRPAGTKSVNSLLEDRTGKLWVGWWDPGGATRYDGSTWRSFTEPGGRSDGSLARVTAMLEDRSGNLWFTTGDAGVSRFDGSTWRVFTSSDGLVDWFLHPMLEDHAGGLWVGSDGGYGVNRYDGTAWQNFTTADGLAGNTVFSLLEDRSRNLWFATDHGLSRYDGVSWCTLTIADGLGDSIVVSMLEDRSGNLWFRTNTNGVSRFDGVTWRIFTIADIGLSVNGVDGLLGDRAGNLWVWTFNGVSRYDGVVWRTISTADGLVSTHVYTMFEDQAGNLWFGTTEGLSRYDGATWQTFTTADGLAENSVWAMTEDRAGNLWVRTHSGEVSRYDGVAWQTFEQLNTHSSPLADHAGNVWFADFDGLVRYDGSSWVTFTTVDGLGNNAVSNILEDHAGNLWFTPIGARGLTRYEPDWIPPRTVFLTRPAGILPSRDHNAVFTAAFAETRVEFSYRFDTGPWSAWSSSSTWIANDLGDGSHSLEVRSRDFLGNLEQGPAVATFEVDATPPAPVIAAPAFGQALRGSVEIRGKATDARFGRYGAAVRRAGAASWDPPDATPLAESSTPVADGLLATWDTASLPDGSYEIRLVVSDTLGLTAADQVTVRVDNHAPFDDQTAPARVYATTGGDIYTLNGELHLYFPPHAFGTDAQVTIVSTSADSVPETLPSGAVRRLPGYEVDWRGATLQKSARLELSLSGVDVGEVGGTLALCASRDGASWRRLGGTVEGDRISLAVSEPGRYALFAGGTEPAGERRLSALSFTPRVFSPAGGFADREVGIGFTLGQASSVTVRVYSRAGWLVREVASGASMGPGANLVRWDGKDGAGAVVTDGLYLVTVEALGQTQTRTLAVVR